MEINKESHEALSELGKLIYDHLLKEMDCTEEEFGLAITENRLKIDNIKFIKNKDGLSSIKFNAKIKDKN